MPTLDEVSPADTKNNTQSVNFVPLDVKSSNSRVGSKTSFHHTTKQVSEVLIHQFSFLAILLAIFHISYLFL